VPGDVVFLENGDLVPADIRLLKEEGLSADESIITGESFPVRKSLKLVTEKTSGPVQQTNMLFMGTSIREGSGMGIVVSTGRTTFFGKTATIMSAKEPPTDFHKNMVKFGNFLMKIIVALTVLVFVTNALMGKGILNSAMFALALAVGITPELLPVIITISLSTGAIHLTRKKVIVKKLASIEDLGNVDVMCVDKTGTLTENRVTLEDYTGCDGKKSEEVLRLGLLCNSAVVEAEKISGNTTDIAIWEFARRNAIEGVTEGVKPLHEIEFDYHRKRMGAVVQEGGKRLLIVKGAPETVFQICKQALVAGKKASMEKHSREIQKRFRRLSRHGFRVIAVAMKDVAEKAEYSVKDESFMTFMGFLIFIDPPKASTREAVQKFHELGVSLKVITGDNEMVTEEICRKVGINVKGRVILGSELLGMGGTEFAEAIERNNVFARVTPEQKLAIVSGLSKNGHVVGFLGDGVNDAPALKAADVGISIDTAIDVAKDSADIILLQKSLMVLGDGVVEGRKTFSNTTKYILNTISANFGNMFTVAISSLFLKFIPLLPSQILAANLISDVPMMTISTDNVDPDSLRKPSRWSIKAITNFMVFFGLISTAFDMVTIAMLLFLVKADPSTFRTAWFLESVLSEIIVTFAIRTKGRFWKSRPSRMLLLSSALSMAATMLLIYSPMAFLFEFDQLTVPILWAIGIILAAYFLLAEVAKKKFYNMNEKVPVQG
jgi:Mg2+-importing ATPase